MKKFLMPLATLAVCALAAVVLGKFLWAPRASPPPHIASTPVDLSEVRAKAEAGNPQAQAQLGSLYVKGEVITNSYDEAAKWYRRAADQGNANGQMGLAELYTAGRGLPRDATQALKYYQLAAEQGHSGAQYTLGFMFESGRGVAQSHVQATKWYRLAAEQGESQAQFDLGQRYELGLGVPTDHIEAVKWLRLAAAQGLEDAGRRAKEIENNMSRKDIDEAKRRVAAFTPGNSSPPAK